MSDFKIVCGTNPEDKTIINLDMIRELCLVKDISDNFVKMFDRQDRIQFFKTDLTTLEQVFLCLSKSNEVIFSIDSLNKNIKNLEENRFELRDKAMKEIGIEKVEDRYTPIKED